MPNTTERVPRPDLDLNPARSEFDRWRRSRRRGERIPAWLWQIATTAVAAHGVSKTSQALHLDYYALQRRLASGAIALSSTAAEFVELSLPGSSRGPRCPSVPVGDSRLDRGSGAEAWRASGHGAGGLRSSRRALAVCARDRDEAGSARISRIYLVDRLGDDLVVDLGALAAQSDQHGVLGEAVDEARDPASGATDVSVLSGPSRESLGDTCLGHSTRCPRDRLAGERWC